MDLTLMTFGCLGTFIKYLDKYVEVFDQRVFMRI